MKELYFFDETFYWCRSGRRATVIEAECELTQSVRPDELRKAVVSALRVHRNFRARPVIVGRRFFVEDSEAEQVMVVSEADGLPRNVGTKETGGLMLYVSYGERRFTLHVFHGLADMRSICRAEVLLSGGRRQSAGCRQHRHLPLPRAHPRGRRTGSA